MQRKLALFISFLLLTYSVGWTQEGARSAYDQGKYTEALETLQKAGLHTAADFYNAGNALYKMGRLGQALAYYEKAYALAPHHSDIQFNLNLTRESLTRSGGIAKDQSFWFGSFVPVARRIPEAFVDLLLAFVTCGLALVAYRAKKLKRSFPQIVLQPNFLMTLGLWVFVCAFTGATIVAHRAKLAAIVAELGVARSGPAETFTELFKLPAGTTVELTGEAREGWRQIRFSLGNVGWIGDKDLLEL